MKRLVRAALITGAALAAGAAELRALDRAETRERAYPDVSAARRAGEQARGWLPAFVPEAATDLRIAGNLDTGRHWLRFALPARARGTLVGGLEPLSLTQVWAADTGAPRWLAWWPPDLRAAPFVPPPGRSPLAAFRAPATGYCLAADTLGTQVYVWSCEAAS